MIQSAYIHIPFCRSICSYCDFCKMFYEEKMASSYLESLQDEISSFYQKETLNTIYIGGGTPSALSLDLLENLFHITDQLLLSSSYEFTFECNIEDITPSLLQILKEHRVNRLSIGIESFHIDHLKTLNRNIQAADISSKIQLVKEYSFQNINIDLMYALPNQTLEEVREDVLSFLKLDVPHISVYSLILEEHTALSIQGIVPIDTELDATMYQEIETVLEQNGYSHYEVSNYAKEGYQSKHNLTYWNNEEYYGFGLGAGGYVQGVRYTNTRSINNYIKHHFRFEEESLSEEEKSSNEMILGLRKLNGVSKQDFFKKHGQTIPETYDIIDLLENHLLEENETHFFIPRDKIYVSNEILIRFL